MALEIEGTLRQKLAVQSGTSARGAWSKQEFILEYPDGNFTAQVCFTAFGTEKVAELDKYNPGDKIKVSFNLRSREFNGRWYTDLQIWRIAPAGAPTQGGYAQAPQGGYAPAQGSYAPAPTPPPAPAVPAPTVDDMPAAEGEDDLPF